MRRVIARSLLARFGARYDYDTAYLRAMLERAPGAFFKFSKIMAVAGHRKVVPRGPYFAAKLAAAMEEDCGPCTQLVVNMAREAGVSEDQIEAVLTGRTDEMSDEVAAGWVFARAMCRHEESGGMLEEAREEVRERWGEEGVIELSLAVAIGRVFPQLKAGLGFARECRRVSVDGRPIDVFRQAV